MRYVLAALAGLLQECRYGRVLNGLGSTFLGSVLLGPLVQSQAVAALSVKATFALWPKVIFSLRERPSAPDANFLWCHLSARGTEETIGANPSMAFVIR